MALNWWKPKIEGVLLDVTGVLYNSGNGGHAIDGSVEALNKLKRLGIPLRLCTNETQCSQLKLLKKLESLSFTLELKEIFSPIPAVCQILNDRRLRPYLLVHNNVKSEFSQFDQNNPNCVVIGDAAEEFSYQNLNEAFRFLTKMKPPILISMGRGKYYRENDVLNLDVGVYMKALEYACDVQAEIVGKPSKAFFMTALNDMKISPSQAVMVGDDIVNDVGGAQECGIRGILVRTGKFRPSDEKHSEVKPDGIVDNLAECVELILKQFGH